MYEQSKYVLLAHVVRLVFGGIWQMYPNMGHKVRVFMTARALPSHLLTDKTLLPNNILIIFADASALRN